MGSRYTPVSTEPASPPWTIPRGLIVLLALAATVVAVAGQGHCQVCSLRCSWR